MVGTALPSSDVEAAFLVATGPMIGKGIGLLTDAAVSKVPVLGTTLWGGASAVVESSAVGAVGTTQRGGFIFRGDARSPDVIFDQGFQPRGTNQDLLRYALENEPSIYVPTSKSPTVAREFAEMQGGGYVYTIRGQPQGVDMNAVLGSKSPFPLEFEMAIPGGIKPVEIMGARQVTTDGKFVGPLIKNSAYPW